MKIHAHPSNGGSLLIIVLWIVLGLVTITLYFGNTMNFEMRAADNAVSGMKADETIEGAARYVATVLTDFATNGAAPDVTSYQSEAVPVGESHFWLIGRPVEYENQVQPDQVFFGLVDEGSKLNLNTVLAQSSDGSSTNQGLMLESLTNMPLELAANVVDWRSTNVSLNGDGPSIYSSLQPPYYCKSAPYETVDELRLIYPMDMGILFGEDFNLNGVLDPNEADTNRNGVVDPGLLEYSTVYSREPTSGRISVNPVDTTQLQSLLETNLDSGRATQIINTIQPPGGGGPGGRGPGGGGPGGGGGAAAPSYASPLAFYRASGMTVDEFGLVAHWITSDTNSFIVGRINVNTASPAVLACLPGMTPDLVQQLVTYRQQNPNNLKSVAWIVEALGQNNSDALTTLAAGDYITTESYQFTADIAALGPYGRGYRRVKFVFDVSGGTPRIIYRQDLTHLGWALGKYVRQAWLLAKDTR